MLIKQANAGSFGSSVVTNGTIETGDLTGWTSLSGGFVSGISGSSAADNSTSSSGSYSVKITLTNATSTYVNAYQRITQNITLSGDTYYQFSVDVLGSPSYIDLYIPDASTAIKRITDVTGIPSSTWRTMIFNFKTPSGSPQSATINIRAQGVSAGQTKIFWVDNIVVREITSLDKPEFTVAAIGDSQVSHLALWPEQENDMAYSWLSTAIRKAQIDNVIVTPPLNKGVAGNTAAQVAARVQSDIVDASPKPEICYVAVGTNDAAQGINIVTFKNNIVSILQTLKNGNVRPVLFKITPRKDSVDIAPYNNAITEAASEQEVTLFDPTPVFDAYPSWQTDWMDDNVHYNSSGHFAIGKSLGTYLSDFVVSPSAFTPILNTSTATNNTTPTITFNTTDNVGVDHYTVQVDSGSESTQVSPYTLPALSEGNHIIVVKAYDALWNATAGTTINLTILPIAPTIGAPTVLSSSAIRWNFTDNADNETGFRLYNSNGTLIKTVASANLSYIEETGLNPGTTYSRYIKAYNSYGESVPSAVMSSQTGSAPASSNPPASPSPTSGNPLGGFRVVINDNATSTNTRNVSLKFYATEEITKVAISESPHMSGSSFQTFQSVLPWTLSQGNGLKTIYAVLANQYGAKTPIISDSITLIVPDQTQIAQQQPETDGTSDGSQAQSTEPDSIEDISLPNIILEKPINQMTQEEIASKMKEIQQAIAQLQFLLSQIQPSTNEILGIPSDFQFPTNIRANMSLIDVKYLQILLNQDKDTQVAQTGAGSSGNETTFFGPKTTQAVIKFQEKYKDTILTPWNLDKGTGFVGKTTREKLNGLIGK